MEWTSENPVKVPPNAPEFGIELMVLVYAVCIAVSALPPAPSENVEVPFV
jgi:hypothetical protein